MQAEHAIKQRIDFATIKYPYPRRRHAFLIDQMWNDKQDSPSCMLCPVRPSQHSNAGRHRLDSRVTAQSLQSIAEDQCPGNSCILGSGFAALFGHTRWILWLSLILTPPFLVAFPTNIGKRRWVAGFEVFLG